MCSRYNLTSPAEAVRAYFRHDNELPFPPRYNIAPTQPVTIVRLDHAGRREHAIVRWGLIPSWVKDPRTFSTLINARAETVAGKPSFRGALRHRRCLVPANGFYEWTGAPGSKQPHLIAARDGGLLAFAGLHEHWQGADGSEMETMAIITVPANPDVAPIHDRMPAKLPPEAFDDWLDVKGSEVREVLALLQPAPAGALTCRPVNRRLSNSRLEGPELIAPA